MKYITGILAAMLLSTTMLTSVAAARIEGDSYAGVYDKYLWRGFDLSGSMPVAQGGIDISTAGVTLSLWGNMQLRSDRAQGYNSGEITETDITIDYTHKFNDIFTVGVGNIVYVLDGMDNTNEAYLSIAADTLLQPSFTVYYDWDEAEQNGLFYTLSIAHDFAVSDDVTVNLATLISYNQSSDYSIGNYNGLHNYEVSVGADYTITSRLDVAVSLMFSQGISSAAKDVLDAETVSGITVNYTF